MTTLKGPLKGIKVLDLTRLLPGPLATQYLADLGADVIKIEDKDRPDYIRFFPPQIKGQSVHYLSLNRSKRSLAFKLDSEEGRKLFFDLVAESDIVLEGFRPGWMEKMGFSYEAAKAVNPKIIYVSITGYGRKGPLVKKAGHDLNYIGYSGVLGLGGVDKKVVMPGVQIADILGGSYNAVIACMSAVLGRAQTGVGEHIDVSMTDGNMPMMSLPLGEYLNTNTNYKAGDFFLSGGLANYHVYGCKDGKFVALGSLEPKFWMGFCTMVNKPEWMNEALPIPEKVTKLKANIEALFQTKNRDEWIEMAESFDICLSPVLELDEIEHHPNTVERNMILEHEHPEYGKIKSVAQPLKFSNTELHEGWAAPLLGEHNENILEELGYTQDAIQQLVENGVINKMS